MLNFMLTRTVLLLQDRSYTLDKIKARGQSQRYTWLARLTRPCRLQFKDGAIKTFGVSSQVLKYASAVSDDIQQWKGMAAFPANPVSIKDIASERERLGEKMNTISFE